MGKHTKIRHRWFRRRQAHVPQDRVGWFGEETEKAFALAREEARRLNHNYLGTEHLLLGLVRDENGTAGRVLASLNIELAGVRSAVESILRRGEGMVTNTPGLTPRAKKVLEFAQDEARRLRSKTVCSEHLLLGLVREGGGIAAGVLESLGVGLESVRTQVMTAIAMPGGALPPLPPLPQRGHGTAINQPYSVAASTRANELVYGLSLPPETFTKLVAAAQRLGRPVDDLIREAIARTWLAGLPPEESPRPSPDAP